MLPPPAEITSALARGTGSLVFVFCVTGPIRDQDAGSGLASSWTEPDAAHSWRRDALARCIAAALWEQTAAEAPQPSARLHTDVRVCILLPESGWRVWLDVGFAVSGQAILTIT